MEAWRAALLNVMLGVLLGACGPDQTSGSGDGFVSSAGPGQGTAASGIYAIESLSVGCAGVCAVPIDGGLFSVCDVGTRLDAVAEVRQDDGLLVIDIEDSDYVSRLEGRIDADGGFDVTGVRTLFGTTLTSSFHVTGAIVEQGGATMMEGDGSGKVTGTSDGATINCNIAVEITGQRTDGMR